MTEAGEVLFSHQKQELHSEIKSGVKILQRN